MTNYRRNFVPGGSFFFTVNLADRRQQLLTKHVDALREAFRYVTSRHPLTIDAVVILPEHLHAHRMVREGILPEDWAGHCDDDGALFGERK